jgi:hypothetical protein
MVAGQGNPLVFWSTQGSPGEHVLAMGTADEARKQLLY